MRRGSTSRADDTYRWMRPGIRSGRLSPGQLTEARVATETIVPRESIEHGDVSWESNVLATHHELSRTPLQDDLTPVTGEWQAAHAAYHAALLEACPNRRLLVIATGLRDTGKLYRCWPKGLGADLYDGRDVPAEQRRLLDATQARDTNGAIAALVEHIESSSTLLMRIGRAQSVAGASSTTPRPRPDPVHDRQRRTKE
jgi:DNA-binding GntR family transcriptional regulator